MSNVDRNAANVPIYCICQQPEDGFMICCDVCEEWFHGTCVSITPEQADAIDRYVCPPCQQAARPTTAQCAVTAMPPLTTTAAPPAPVAAVSSSSSSPPPSTTLLPSHPPSPQAVASPPPKSNGSAVASTTGKAVAGAPPSAVGSLGSRLVPLAAASKVGAVATTTTSPSSEGLPSVKSLPKPSSSLLNRIARPPPPPPSGVTPRVGPAAPKAVSSSSSSSSAYSGGGGGGTATKAAAAATSILDPLPSSVSSPVGIIVARSAVAPTHRITDHASRASPSPPTSAAKLAAVGPSGGGATTTLHHQTAAAAAAVATSGATTVRTPPHPRITATSRESATASPTAVATTAAASVPTTAVAATTATAAHGSSTIGGDAVRRPATAPAAATGNRISVPKRRILTATRLTPSEKMARMRNQFREELSRDLTKAIQRDVADGSATPYVVAADIPSLSEDLARDIEAALWRSLAASRTIFEQYSEITARLRFNLSAVAGVKLRQRVVSREPGFDPDHLVRLSNEELAPDELATLRRHLQTADSVGRVREADLDRASTDEVIVHALPSVDSISAAAAAQQLLSPLGGAASAGAPPQGGGGGGGDSSSLFGTLAAMLPPSSSPTDADPHRDPADEAVPPPDGSEAVDAHAVTPPRQDDMRPTDAAALDPLVRSSPSPWRPPSSDAMTTTTADDAIAAATPPSLSRTAASVQRRLAYPHLLSAWSLAASVMATASATAAPASAAPVPSPFIAAAAPVVAAAAPATAAYPVVWSGTLTYHAAASADVSVTLRRIHGPAVDRLFRMLNIRSFAIENRTELRKTLAYLPQIDLSSTRIRSLYLFEPNTTIPGAGTAYAMLFAHLHAICRAGVVTFSGNAVAAQVFKEIYVCPVVVDPAGSVLPEVSAILPSAIARDGAARLWLAIISDKHYTESMLANANPWVPHITPLLSGATSAPAVPPPSPVMVAPSTTTVAADATMTPLPAAAAAAATAAPRLDTNSLSMLFQVMSAQNPRFVAAAAATAAVGGNHPSPSSPSSSPSPLPGGGPNNLPHAGGNMYDASSSLPWVVGPPPS